MIKELNITIDANKLSLYDARNKAIDTSGELIVLDVDDWWDKKLFE